MPTVDVSRIERQRETSSTIIENKLKDLVHALQQTHADASLIKYCIDELQYISATAKKPAAGVRHDRVIELMQLVVNRPTQPLLQRVLHNKRIVTALLSLAVGVLMIAAGFTMIVLPATHDFELYTLFYFNPNDGFTLMDLFSLMIVFGGVFIIVNSVKRK